MELQKATHGYMGGWISKVTLDYTWLYQVTKEYMQLHEVTQRGNMWLLKATLGCIEVITH